MIFCCKEAALEGISVSVCEFHLSLFKCQWLLWHPFLVIIYLVKENAKLVLSVQILRTVIWYIMSVCPCPAHSCSANQFRNQFIRLRPDSTQFQSISLSSSQEPSKCFFKKKGFDINITVHNKFKAHRYEIIHDYD